MPGPRNRRSHPLTLALMIGVLTGASCSAKSRGNAPSAGNKAPPSNLTETNVLVYGVGHRDGSVSLIVRADGSAEYSARNPDVGEKQVRGVVKPDELKALAAVLRQHRFCDLSSGRTEGAPDEARPSIAVHIEDVDCKVELWDNEFQDNPNAKACLRAVEDLASAVEKRGE